MNADRIAIVGAGAVGCYFGGMLARAGVPVTLIGRASHVDAIRNEFDAPLLLSVKAFARTSYHRVARSVAVV